MTIVPTFRGTLPKGPDYNIGLDAFKEYVRTRNVEYLQDGREAMRKAGDKSSFIDRLLYAGAKRTKEFPRFEYEAKLNVDEITQNAQNTGSLLGNGVGHTSLLQELLPVLDGNRYVADSLRIDQTKDVHYFAIPRRSLVIEQAIPHLKTKVKWQVPMIARKYAHLVTKRAEETTVIGTKAEEYRLMQAIADVGGRYIGPATQGKSHVDVLDTFTGRIFTISSSETEANRQKLYQIEAEYLTSLTPLENLNSFYRELRLSEGISHLARHLLAHEFTFTIDPTKLTKQQFVQGAWGNREALEEKTVSKRHNVWPMSKTAENELERRLRQR